MSSTVQPLHVRAHPNIALVKYWGKQAGPGNRPAVPSLSITLDSLYSSTELRPAAADSLALDGAEPAPPDERLARFLSAARERLRVPPLAVVSHNNFPTAAGLASSAAGFAALAFALNESLALGLDSAELSELARCGSASAARSLYGGFVGLTGPDYRATPLAEAGHWPLEVAIALTSSARKRCRPPGA